MEMSGSQDHRYGERIRQFDEAVLEARRVSQAAAGRQTNARPYWASVLFTRLCTFSVTLLGLAPRSRFAPKHFEHFDCASCFTVARNVVDAYLIFYYLCVEAVTDDEWRYRLALVQLNDCLSRQALFRDLGHGDDKLRGFAAQAAELRNRISELPPFKVLPENQQRHRLRGDTPMYLSQDEVLGRMGADRAHFRVLYRLVSAHVHSLPLGFYRMGERQQGRGTESDLEKRYTELALEIADWPLRRATAEMSQIFPDIPPFNIRPNPP